MKLKKFFATMLAVATVASFATVSHAALDETAGFYTYETVVTPAEINPGDAVTIEVYIKGKDGEDISIGKNASSTIKAAVKVPTSVFAIDGDTDWYSDDYWVDDVTSNAEVSCSADATSAIISMSAKANKKALSLAADEPVFTVYLLASETAKAGTGYKAEIYKDNIGMMDNSTSPYTQALSANINVSEGTFAVKAAAQEDKTTATIGANGEVTFDYADADAADAKLADKKVVLGTAYAGNLITADTTVKVTYTPVEGAAETKTFGETLFEKLDVEGFGFLETESITFGIVCDKTMAGTFSFALN